MDEEFLQKYVNKWLMRFFLISDYIQIYVLPFIINMYMLLYPNLMDGVSLKILSFKSN